MATVTYRGSKEKLSKRSWTPYEIITGQNLRPAYGQIASRQPIELADQEGNLIQRSTDEGAPSKSSGSNFNGCGHEVTEEYLINQKQ